jgi:heptosyltransferase-2
MTHGIGDVVMTVPVLKVIARNKDVQFSITVKSETEATVINELCPELDIKYIYFQDILRRKGQILAFLILSNRIRRLAPDIIIAQYSIDAPKSSIASFFAGVKKRVGWKGPFSFLNTFTLETSGAHKIEENLRVLKSLNIVPEKNDVSYPMFTPITIEFNSSHLKNKLDSNKIKIVISPGSGEAEKHKRWPAKHFSLLLDKIVSDYENVSVFFVGTEREKSLCQEIVAKVKNKQSLFNLAGELSVTDLLLLLTKASLTISNCNGVSHLACCANSPIIGLYGPTNHKITAPISDSFVPLTAGLDCAPCYRKGYETGCENPICMDRIQVEDVYIKVKNILKKIF